MDSNHQAGQSANLHSYGFRRILQKAGLSGSGFNERSTVKKFSVRKEV